MKPLTFEVTGTQLIVTDPCYRRGTWCQLTLDNVRPGKWTGSADRIDVPEWGCRVDKLFANALGAEAATEWCQAGKNGIVGVDSGQAGIFDEKRYPSSGTGEYSDAESFYGRACCATQKVNVQVGIIDEGIVSSSGFGDGAYDCYVKRDAAGQIVAVQIDFGVSSSIENFGVEEDNE